MIRKSVGNNGKFLQHFPLVSIQMKSYNIGVTEKITDRE